MKRYLVTGGAGFIGSNFVLTDRRREVASIVNLDLLTYAGNLMNLESLEKDPKYIFVKGDIGDRQRVRGVFEEYRPCAVINFESGTLLRK